MKTVIVIIIAAALLGLAGCGAGVYFATLWVMGFRLKDFRRRAAE